MPENDKRFSDFKISNDTKISVLNTRLESTENTVANLVANNASNYQQMRDGVYLKISELETLMRQTKSNLADD